MTKLLFTLLFATPLFCQTYTVPQGPTLPASCSVVQLFFLTTQTPGQNIYGCTSPNNWVAEGTGSKMFTATGQKTVVRTAEDKLEELVSLDSTMRSNLIRMSGRFFLPHAPQRPSNRVSWNLDGSD